MLAHSVVLGFATAFALAAIAPDEPARRLLILFAAVCVAVAVY